ncbi:hypothetical protein BaRGS_00038247, partial [Batillaria attramentaria]
LLQLETRRKGMEKLGELARRPTDALYPNNNFKEEITGIVENPDKRPPFPQSDNLPLSANDKHNVPLPHLQHQHNWYGRRHDFRRQNGWTTQPPRPLRTTLPPRPHTLNTNNWWYQRGIQQVLRQKSNFSNGRPERSPVLSDNSVPNAKLNTNKQSPLRSPFSPPRGSRQSPQPSPPRGSRQSPQPSPQGGSRQSPQPSPQRGSRQSPQPSPQRGSKQSPQPSPQRGTRQSPQPSPQRGTRQSPQPSPLGGRRGSYQTPHSSSPWRQLREYGN